MSGPDPGIGTGLFVGAVVLTAGGFLVHTLSQAPSIDISGTATGPCAAMPAGTTVATANVYVGGKLVATGDVGRWSPTPSGACSASVNVSDVGAAANFYTLRIGPMRARMSANDHRFGMEIG